MWIRSKEYWISVIHPVSIGFFIESIIRRITFGVYKPFITALICGVLEEWHETRKFNRGN